MTTQTLSGTIFVVDDTPANLHLLRNILARRGYDVRPIPSGTMALKIIRSILPDLILLDIMMPDMNGYEVCRQLKADSRTRAIPVIFISAINELGDKVKAFEVGGVDYITKPFQADEVLARVKTHLVIQKIQKELQQAHDELEVRVDELATLNMIIQAVATTNDLDQTLHHIAGTMMHLLEVQAVSIGLLDATKTELTIITQGEQSNEAVQVVGLTVPISKDPLVQQVIERGQTFIITDAQSNPLTTSIRAIIQARQINSIMVVPLVSRAGVIGTINLSSTIETDAFDNSKIQLAETIAGQIAGAIENVRLHEEQQKANIALSAANKRMQEDLTLARSIQQGLLPAPHPNWSQHEVVCFTAPANEIGGDFYVYQSFSQEAGSKRYGLAVGDVSGKGVSAALLMAASLAQFDASLLQPLSLPVERMAYLDEVLTPYTQPRQQNCAMCYVELRIENSSQGHPKFLIDIVNAGCIPPYIKRVDGSVEQLEIGGFALGQGLGAELGYQQATLELYPGDMVILTSDGVVEANNEAGMMLGFDRLKQIVSDFTPLTADAGANLPASMGAGSSAEATLEYLKQAVFAFTGDAEQHDDMTIVVIKV